VTDTNPPVKDLAEKVAARKQWLQMIIPFVLKMIEEMGNEIYRGQYSSNPRITRGLYNFGKFSFVYKFGQTHTDYEDIKIFYSPDGHRKNVSLVLIVCSQNNICNSPNEWRVELFKDNGLLWKADLDQVIVHQEEVVRERLQNLERLNAKVRTRQNGTPG